VTDDRRLVDAVLGTHEQFYRCLFAGQFLAWMHVDLTMAQLKTLMIAVGQQGATGGQLARGLGCSLSTVTGVVDRLVAHGFVTRSEDPIDRRITRVDATPAGQALVERLYLYRLERMRRVLEGLSADELQTVHRAMEYLSNSATRLVDEEVPERVDLPRRAPAATQPQELAS
jgi:DNA-binding MarR family transcriptional regulator